MAFAQLAYRESLRDIQACLRSNQQKLYHMGIRGKVSRNTLANANQVRDWRIYADFAHILIARARSLHAHENIGVQLEQAVYAFDATTIDLCLSLFPWASENAVKIQIWIAIAVYVLVAIIKKQLKSDRSLYTILQILSVSLFEKVPLSQLLTEMEPQNEEDDSSNQLFLFK